MIDFIEKIECPKCQMEADKWKETTAGHEGIYHISCLHCDYEKSYKRQYKE